MCITYIYTHCRVCQTYKKEMSGANSEWKRRENGYVSFCKAKCYYSCTFVNKLTKQYLYYLNVFNNKKHGCVYTPVLWWNRFCKDLFRLKYDTVCIVSWPIRHTYYTALNCKVYKTYAIEIDCILVSNIKCMHNISRTHHTWMNTLAAFVFIDLIKHRSVMIVTRFFHKTFNFVYAKVYILLKLLVK